MMHKELRAMIICVWYDYFNIMHILACGGANLEGKVMLLLKPFSLNHQVS